MLKHTIHNNVIYYTLALYAILVFKTFGVFFFYLSGIINLLNLTFQIKIKKVREYLERWLVSCKHVLIFQRIPLQFPASVSDGSPPATLVPGIQRPQLLGTILTYTYT